MGRFGRGLRLAVMVLARVFVSLIELIIQVSGGVLIAALTYLPDDIAEPVLAGPKGRGIGGPAMSF